jgi:hypothetical protein
MGETLVSGFWRWPRRRLQLSLPPWRRGLGLDMFSPSRCQGNPRSALPDRVVAPWRCFFYGGVALAARGVPLWHLELMASSVSPARLNGDVSLVVSYCSRRRSSECFVCHRQPPSWLLPHVGCILPFARQFPRHISRGGNRSDTDQIMPFPYLFPYFQTIRIRIHMLPNINSDSNTNTYRIFCPFGAGMNIRK